MPPGGSQRTEALAGEPPRRWPPRRRPLRLRLAILVSLLIHIAIGGLLVVTSRREQKPEQLPPPSAVTMLFEGGRKNGPTLPDPELQATPSVPADLEAPPPADTPLRNPPVPPAPARTAAPARATPIPSPPPPSAPPPPDVTALPVEVPPPRPSPVAKQPPAPRTPAPRTPAPPKPSEFPAPMNFSFGTPHPAASSAVRPRSRPHIPGTIDMSLGPASRGTADPTPFSERDEDAAGADWRNALSLWVAEHAYYPEQARHEFQEGDVKVHVVAQPNGRVKEVLLVRKSGSMWLDLALLALFRDQRIPPLPSGEKEPIEFDFTMHYVLIRPH